MKKYAFFVEGQTEAVFTKRLIEEISNTNSLQVDIDDQKYFTSIKVKEPDDAVKLFILIVDCHGDAGVKQKIKDNENALFNSGYSKIVGLRDLFPLEADDLHMLIDELYTGLDNVEFIHIVVAVMEIEAWFIQEHQHFINLNPVLTPQFIHDEIGFNPLTDDATNIRHPSDTLNTIYEKINLVYDKKLFHIQTTVDHLDYEELYVNVREKIPQLNEFINEIDVILNA